MGVSLAVNSEKVGQTAFHQHGWVDVSLPFQPFLKLNDILHIIPRYSGSLLGINNQCAIHAKCLLAVRFFVGMVKECTCLLCREFIFVGFARLDRLLCNVSRAIHIVRYNQTVPVNRCWFRKMVGHVNPKLVALANSNAWPWDLVVESVGHHSFVRKNVPFNHGHVKIEDFYAVFEAWFKWLITFSIYGRNVAYRLWIYGCHVAHGLTGCIVGHNHARRHDNTPYISRTQSQVCISSGNDDACCQRQHCSQSDGYHLRTCNTPGRALIALLASIFTM